MNAGIERLEGELLRMKPVDIRYEHHFAPGVYLRYMDAPAGTFIIGHEHKNECVNILLSGSIRVMINGVQRDLVAPFNFISAAGIRKVALTLTDVRWLNVFITNETDVEKLEELLIVKSTAFLDHEAEMKRLEEKCP